MWDACRVPFVPELFSAPALARLEDKWRLDELVAVPYFDGLMAGEPDALVGSSPRSPSCTTPCADVSKARERSRPSSPRSTGGSLGATSRSRTSSMSLVRDAASRRWFYTSMVRRDELRIYSSTWPLTDRHANRPPLLQPDRELRESDVVAEYQRALAAGRVDAIVAAFEPDGYAREPAGGQYIHRGRDDLRSFYQLLFSNDGGIPLERCALVDDGRACALEYNVVQWGKTEVPPEAGVAVYVRGQSGKLAAVRIYDDADPQLAPRR
jgi:hypothetical protein